MPAFLSRPVPIAVLLAFAAATGVLVFWSFEALSKALLGRWHRQPDVQGCRALVYVVRIDDQRLGELEAQARNRSIIDLFNQVETLRSEFARLRGQSGSGSAWPAA